MAVIADVKCTKKMSDGSVKETVRYKATITLKGFPRTSKTFDRKTTAKDWAEKTEYEYKQQRAFGTVAYRNKTVIEAVARYENALKSTQSRRHKDVAYILRWWVDQIGTVRVGEVTKDLLIQKRDILMTHRVKGNPSKKTLSNASINRMMGVLNRVFNVMVNEWDWLPRNPAEGIKSLPESKGRTRFLQGDEMDRLLAAARLSENANLYAVIVLAITTGARKGEIEKIRIKDIDFTRKRVLLPVTKNGRPRTLYLVGHAYDAIKQIYDRARPNQKYLFSSPHDESMPNDFRTAWQVAVKRSGLEDFKFHDLRHTAASYYAQNGAGLHQIAEILGHSSFHVTKRYTHLLETDTADVVRTTAERVFGDGKTGLAEA